MSKTTVLLVAFNDMAAQWHNIDLKKLMTRALRIEDKMTTGVLIEDEHKRYGIFCDRIEFYANKLIVEGKAETLDLGQDYLSILGKMLNSSPEEARKARVGANFFPNELMMTQINLFQNLARASGVADLEPVRKRQTFFREALRRGLNIVEIQRPWQFSKTDTTAVRDTKSLEKSFMNLEVSDKISEEKGGGHFVALRTEIEKVVDLTRRGIPAAVNFSDLRHDVIAEIVHDFVYGRGEPVMVDVIYGDGSKAAPFPLFVLRYSDRVKNGQFLKLPVVQVGMMSERHSNDGLDTDVDTYWFRNQEISTGRTQAEIDKVAYEKSKELFKKLRLEGPYRMAFYQTGFQPAVVGFYRALTEELRERGRGSASLEVEPLYFMGGQYKKGKLWS